MLHVFFILLSERISPFPSLEQALNQVDDHLGFFIELKYPQDMFVSSAASVMFSENLKELAS